MNATTYGLDIAKSVFQMYWVDPSTGQIHNQRFSQPRLIQFLSNCPAGHFALEACGGSHWWARKIQSLGIKPPCSIRAMSARSYAPTRLMLPMRVPYGRLHSNRGCPACR